MSGVDLVTVKEILGQASIEMTMRYAHPTTEGEMRAVSTIEKQMENFDKHHSSTEAKSHFNAKSCKQFK